MVANGLSRKTSVISIIAYQCNNARALVDALAAALPSNSTLRYLELGQRRYDDPGYLSPVFLAWGQNTALETLTIYMQGSTEESLFTAINDGLRMN
jgi:hypothetical protein